MKRTATVNWKGSGKDGKGTVSTPSGVLHNHHYSYSTRFEDEIGTNPEELVAAAHASCFTMKLSFLLSAAGFVPDNIDTQCTISFENGAIVESHLEVKAVVPKIDETRFQESVREAKANCPISKLLNTKITAQAILSQAVPA